MRKLPINAINAKRYRQTIQPTDRPTNIAGYKVACIRLIDSIFESMKMLVQDNQPSNDHLKLQHLTMSQTMEIPYLKREKYSTKM